MQDGTQVTYTVRPVGGQQSGSAVFANGQIQATAGIRAGDGLSSSPQLIAQRAGTIQVTAEVLSSRYDPKATFDLVVVAQRPTTIDILNGNYQFVSPNSAFGSPLTVRVLDQVGHAIPGATTNFAVTGPALANGNSRYAPATDPNGQASALLTATDGSGPVTVTVTSGSTSTVFTEYVPYNGIVSMHQLRGQGQQTNSGQPFPARPTVLVQDGQNMGVSGFPVTFKVSGPATFADGAVSATVTSQQDGTAASPTLTATSGSGQVTVVATITGNSASATFTLKVNPVATLTIVGGDRQVPTSTNPVLPTAFRTPLTVKAPKPPAAQASVLWSSSPSAARPTSTSSAPKKPPRSQLTRTGMLRSDCSPRSTARERSPSPRPHLLRASRIQRNSGRPNQLTGDPDPIRNAEPGETASSSPGLRAPGVFSCPRTTRPSAKPDVVRPSWQDIGMQRVLGIGGYFMWAADPAALGVWYRDCLGLDADDNGLWRQGAGPTVFATFESETDYFGSPAQQTMINFRVPDLDAMLAKSRQGSRRGQREQDMEGVGRFGWVIDPEGNRVSLWKPPNSSPPPPLGRDRLGFWLSAPITIHMQEGSQLHPGLRTRGIRRLFPPAASQ